MPAPARGGAVTNSVSAPDALALRYRRSTPDDVPALLDLWERDAGWGRLTRDQWRAWFEAGPWGPAVIVVGEAPDGSLAAQMQFAPTRMYVTGREVLAARLSAPIIRSDLRDTTLRRADHPLPQLLKAGFDALRAEGVSVVYARPAPSWTPYLHVLRRLAAGDPQRAALHGIEEFPCVACPGEALAETPEASITTRDVCDSDAAVDRLWQQSAAAIPLACAVVRDARFVRYRLSGHTVRFAYDTQGELIGYVAFDTTTRLLVDWLAVSRELLEPVLRTGMASILSDSPGPVKAVRTAVTAEVLDRLGFAPVDYTFVLGFEWLRDDDSPDQLAAPHWYLGGLD
jgi:hypothetical protein